MVGKDVVVRSRAKRLQTKAKSIGQAIEDKIVIEGERGGQVTISLKVILIDGGVATSSFESSDRIKGFGLS